MYTLSELEHFYVSHMTYICFTLFLHKYISVKILQFSAKKQEISWAQFPIQVEFEEMIALKSYLFWRRQVCWSLLTYYLKWKCKN